MLWVSLVDLAVCSVGSWAGRGAVLRVCNFLLCKTAGLLDCWMAGVVEDVEGWVALAECSIALGPKRRDMRGPQHLTTAT